MITSCRAVFDTGTLVSAALRPSSASERALTLALRSGLVCADELTLQRLRSVLASTRFDRYLPKRLRMAFAGLLSRNAWLCPVSLSDVSAIRPPGRDRTIRALLALAAAAEADVIVSSDRYLLARKTWRRIPIISPDEFITRYDPVYTGFTVTVLEAAKAKWLFPLRKSHPDRSEDRRHQL